MGLEATEALIRIEDAFDIRIDGDDPDIAQIRKVADLYVAVLNRLTLRQNPRATCLQTYYFFKLRRVVAGAAGTVPRAIPPAASLTGLIPWWRRKSLWREFSTLHVNLPSLTPNRHSRWIQYILFSVGGTAAVAALVLAATYSEISAGIILACVIAMGTAALNSAQKKALSWDISADCGTVFDFARSLASRENNIQALQTSPAEIWNKLVAILETTTFSRERIQPDFDLIDDLDW